MTPPLRLPEPRKQPGVHYALTDEGVELPVIDVTHPAFQGEPDEADLERMVDHSLREMRRFAELPAPGRWLVTRLLLSRGALTRGIVGARGAYLGGMATYLLKVPPALLGPYARRMDRTVARSLPCVSVRLRLRRVAGLLAEAIAARLEPASRRPVELWDVAGGPAADALNALLLLRRDRPGLLEPRRLAIQVLDLDEVGPRFGARALDALRAEGAPLAGLQATLRHLPYDWRDPARLPRLDPAADPPLVVVASEGGLFEYGSDEEVAENLARLRERTPPDTVVVGSICRADGAAAELNSRSGAAIRLRSLEAFSALVQPVGWRVARSVSVPLAWCLAMERV
jgi:hypothetical protein